MPRLGRFLFREQRAMIVLASARDIYMTWILGSSPRMTRVKNALSSPLARGVHAAACGVSDSQSAECNEACHRRACFLPSRCENPLRWRRGVRYDGVVVLSVPAGQWIPAVAGMTSVLWVVSPESRYMVSRKAHSY